MSVAVSRFLKFMIGLALLPACVAATRAALKLVLTLKPLEGFTASAWGFVLGFALWVFLYLALPAPIRAYILAHELTHALWGLAMGARVKRLKVSNAGGSVTLTKSNVLITLAPYFFPLYTILVVIAYLACARFFDLRTYHPFWLGLMGLTWAFHLTFTLHALRQRQPDIQEHGRVFSWALIYLINLLTLGVWIVVIASPSLAAFGGLLLRELRWTLEEYTALLNLLRHGLHALL
jgi:hypothetical protein